VSTPADDGQVVVPIGRGYVLGMYKVRGGMITVTTRYGRKSAELGDLPPDHVARLMVRELARDAGLS
jgi:hypothetical protein